MRDIFRRFANKTSMAMGSPSAFFLALSSVIIWLATGPYFKWSEAHQLSINTGTTIITFLAVFLIQSSQNRESRTIQAKLDALIAAQSNVSNRLIALEDEAEEELDKAVEEIKSMRDD